MSMTTFKGILRQSFSMHGSRLGFPNGPCNNLICFANRIISYQSKLLTHFGGSIMLPRLCLSNCIYMSVRCLFQLSQASSSVLYTGKSKKAPVSSLEKFTFFFIDLTRGTNLWKNEQKPNLTNGGFLLLEWFHVSAKPRFGGFCDVALRYSDQQYQCHLKENFQVNSHRTCHAIPGLPCPSEAPLWCPSNNLKCKISSTFWTWVTVVLQVSMKLCLLHRTGWYLYDQFWEKKNYINHTFGCQTKIKEWTSFKAVCTTIICLAQLVGPTLSRCNRTVNVHHVFHSVHYAFPAFQYNQEP